MISRNTNQISPRLRDVRELGGAAPCCQSMRSASRSGFNSAWCVLIVIRTAYRLRVSTLTVIDRPR